MRYIDAYNHFFPRRYFDALMQTPAGEKDIGKRVRGIPALYELDQRLRIVEQFENYTQLLSHGLPPVERSFGPEKSPEMARIANDGLAEIVAKHREYKQIEKDLAGAHQMFLEADDQEMKQLAHDEEKQLIARKATHRLVDAAETQHVDDEDRMLDVPSDRFPSTFDRFGESETIGQACEAVAQHFLPLRQRCGSPRVTRTRHPEHQQPHSGSDHQNRNQDPDR